MTKEYCTMENGTVLVPLSQETLRGLLVRCRSSGEDLESFLSRMLLETKGASGVRKARSGRTPRRHHGRAGGYSALLLGETVRSRTLPDLLQQVLNRLADRDTSFLPRLALYQGRRRRHVARGRDGVHAGRDDLNELYCREFRQGWWMSTNHSAADLRRIMRDVCEAAGLAEGRDLILSF